MFSWFADNWKTIVAVGASIVVGVAVTALIIATAPVSLPALLVTTAALAVGGFAGGVTGYLVSHWLYDEPVTLKGALFEGTVAAVVSVATLGLGRVLGPVVSRFVAPVASRALPEVAAPFVTRVVSQGTSFAIAGATTGAGAQVANNALNDRPLTENVDKAAEQGAILGLTVTVLSETAPLLRRGPTTLTSTDPVEPVISKPEPAKPVVAKPIDPVTQTTMDKMGLTPDTIVYRVTEPQYVTDGTITGNPRSMAEVSDPYNLVEHPYQKYMPDVELPLQQPRVSASKLGPSLNVAVKDPSIYSKPGMVKVAIRLGDLLDRGGKIYPDRGAMVEGIQPLIVTFEGSVPVVSVEPVVATSTTTLGAPSPTRGIIGPVSDVSK